MLNRRLVVLFGAFVAGFCALGLRLGHLQLTEAQSWREEMQTFVHRTLPIETSRGTIYDRKGMAIARDVACYDLAIDYRAMTLDEAWVKAQAAERLKGEKVVGKEARAKRLAELQDQIADQIDAEPRAIAQICHLTADEIVSRYNDVRERIQALKQDRWSRPYERGGDKGEEGTPPATTGSPSIVLKEEVSAHTIVPNIPDEVSFYFQQHKEDYPGVVVVDSRRREYRYGDVACQVIGTLRGVDGPTLGGDRFKYPDLVKGADAGNLHGYLKGDLMGESGVEKLMEGVLRGTRGVRLKDLGASGEEEETEGKRVDPQVGGDVQLTVDIGLQSDFQNAVREKHLLRGQDGKDHFAAVVVMSMDGQVLTMWSSETYDLNRMEELRGQLIKDNYRRPLANRTLQAYTPGSTVKPMVAAAALEERVVNLGTTVNCVGYLFPGRPNVFRCSIFEEHHVGHGPVQLVDALEKSCNIYFYTAGRDLGVEKLTKWFDAFGLGRDSGFELPEQDGAIPDLNGAGDADVRSSEAIFLGIGQGPVAVTPLQMAVAYGTLLKGGEVVRPRILAKGYERAGAARMGLAPETVRAVREGMEKVVGGDLGTARKVLGGMKLEVAGKTGSATAWGPVFDDAGQPVWDTSKPVKNEDGTVKVGADGQPVYRQMQEEGTHAWFVGYAPADKPQYVVSALMEFGGHGGGWAAPMAKEAFLQLERHGYLPAVDVAPMEENAGAVGRAD
jgi:penicillin-binding protein 2